MSRLFIIDTGSVARNITRGFIVDAGGVPRLIKRAFIIDAGGVARQFFSPSSFYVGTLNSGWNGANRTGYENGNYGGISPAADRNGRTITNLFTRSDLLLLTLDMTGFVTDPGIGYFTQLTITGSIGTYLSKNATYTPGTSPRWVWTLQNEFNQSGNYGVTLF